MIESFRTLFVEDMTPSQYLDCVRSCIIEQRQTPQPASREQWQALVDSGLAQSRGMLPTPIQARMMGLTLPAEPFSAEWRRRFIETLRVDRDFAEAVCAMIGGAQ